MGKGRLRGWLKGRRLEWGRGMRRKHGGAVVWYPTEPEARVGGRLGQTARLVSDPNKRTKRLQDAGQMLDFMHDGRVELDGELPVDLFGGNVGSWRIDGPLASHRRRATGEDRPGSRQPRTLTYRSSAPASPVLIVTRELYKGCADSTDLGCSFCSVAERVWRPARKGLSDVGPQRLRIEKQQIVTDKNGFPDSDMSW